MPIYEYECTLCHFRFERKQRFDEKSVSICPRCQGKAHRIFHSVPILFKGSGFYSTDHGRGWAGSTKREKAEPAAKEPAKKEGGGTASQKSAESRTEDKNSGTVR